VVGERASELATEGGGFDQGAPPTEGSMTRLALRNAPAPPPRRGHYSDDGRSWIDDVRQGTFTLTDGADMLVVELEEAGGSTFVGSLMATLATQSGQAYYRFIGRARSADRRWPEYAVIGGTFAAPHAFLSLPIPPDEAWAPEMDARLAELRAELVAEGWILAGRGEHPWAYRYTRPWIDL
jgi:hypothetical protein